MNFLNLRRVLPAIVVFTGVFIQSSVNAETPLDQETYRKSNREKMLAILAAGPFIPKLELKELDKAPAKNRAFLEFYRDKILPLEEKMSRYSFEANVLHIAKDRALYDPSPDQKEKKEWTNRQEVAMNALNAIVYSDEWKELTKKWAELSEGLTGEFAEDARLRLRRMEIEDFASKDLPYVDELTSLDNKINTAANDAPSAKNLEAVAKRIGEISDAFKAGKISLADAAQAVSAERARGEEGQSREIAQNVAKELNRQAVVRSILAKSKGYPTWSAYQVASQSEPYADRFNTVEGRIQFLEDALTKTDTALQALVQNLADRNKINRFKMRESHILLLQPDIESLGQYFPVEKMDQIWVETLLEYGFSQEDIDHIDRDVLPRENKYTHAYENEVISKTPKVLKVDSKTLNLDLPSGSDWSQWKRAQIYILQNFLKDSIDEIRVGFHEGGHALHSTHQENPLGKPLAYGYVEIHSMTQEYAFQDVEFILKKALGRSGAKPSRAAVESYIRNAEINEFIQFRILLSRALYELKLWNIDYDAAKTTNFVEQSIKLYGQIIPRGTGVSGTENHGVDSTGRGPFNAPHFRGGDVQYIGYVLAGVSAFLSKEALLDRFQKETGRRTFLEQPKMAQYLIDGYYREGFKKKFPESVEAFTGKKFLSDDYLNHLSKSVNDFIGQNPCVRAVVNLKNSGKNK